jgi:diguanylate cyclase (GGDEF)-like protein
MSAPTGDHLRLLVVEKSKQHAESLAAVLRDAGYSIEYSHVVKTKSLKSQLNRQAPDIVLCGSGSSLPKPKTVLSIIGQHGLTTPVISIADAAPGDAIVAARKTGISALVSYDCPEHLQHAVGQVASMLHLQQRLATLEEALHNSEYRCQTLVDNSSDAIACFRGDLLCYANRPYLDLFAINDPATISKTRLLDTISSEQHELFSGFLENFLSGDTAANELQIDCQNMDGEVFASTVELTLATQNGMPCTQMVIHAKSMNTVLEHRIETLSRQDILTGLNNREQFMELLEQCVSKQQEDAEEAVLVYILLDRFKSIREEVGIASSDMVLRDIANLVEDHAGADDHVARFGEYAFTLLRRGVTLEESRVLGESMLRNIATHVSEVEGRSISTTGSIGICVVNPHSGNAENVVSRADLACEVARSSGGNQVHIHSTEVDEQLAQDDEQQCDSMIRKTIDENRFSLVFLPIVSLKSESGQRYEVLLRVVDEAGNAILPGEFLTIAEKTGYSGEIDRWIISEAFKTLAERRKNGSNISFYIKLSDSTLTDAELPGWINDKLKEYRLVTDGVVFEIPERTAINDLKNSMAFVKAMQKLHCKVALEHYGRSNKVRLLKHLPVDVIKIDGSLIEKLATHKENQARVREIVELARTNDKICIAERVDNANDLAILWQYGIDFIQGNFAQEPSKELNYEFEGQIA